MRSDASVLLWLGRISVLAAAYYIAGRLALLLAIPPGYATAVWPASGIALAAILLFGNRMGPGILLGHFFVNLWTSFDASNALTILKAILLATSIGFGGSLQAVSGAFLIRRFVGFPSPLDEEKDVVKFMALGGPVSCLVSPTLGVMSLWLAGAVAPVELIFHWWTWWVGDTMGVLIVTPLVLIWTGEPREVWRKRRISVAVPLCLLLSALVLLFFYASAWERDRINDDFADHARVLASAIKENLDGHLEVLHSIESFYASATKVDRRDFRTFVQRSFLRHSGLQAVSWDLRVPDAKRADYEEAARQDGYPDFQITEQNIRGELVRAAQRSEYVTVYYIEPYEGNERALGFDVASDPIRLEALSRACDTGKPTATAKITLIQEPGEQVGFLVFLPIYSQGLPHATLEQRRKNLQGFATAVYRAGDIVVASLKGFEKEGIELRFSDETAPIGERLLYGHRTRAGPLDPQNEPKKNRETLRWSTSFEMAGRKWGLTFSPTPAHLLAQRSWQAWGVLAGALLVSALLGAFLLLVTGRTAKIELQVAERTAELSQSNANLRREIVERQREEERAQLQRERAVALHEINRAITSSLDLKTILDLLLEKIDLVLPNSATTVRLFDKERDSLVPVACRNVDETRWRAIKRQGLGGIAKLVLENKTPITAQNVQTDPRSHASEFAREEGLVSYLGVPLIAEGEVLGLIAFYTRAAHAFSDDQIDFLSTIAGQAAIAISNSQLHQEAKKQRDALLESEERFRTIARATNDAVWDWDLATDAVWWSEGVRNLFGYSEEEVGRDATWWYEHIHAEDRERVVKRIHSMIASGAIFWSDEYRYARVDGSFARVFDRGFVIRDGEGNPARMIGAMMDITERKAAEEKLAESEQRLQTIIDLEPECVKLLDRRGTVVEMNPAGLAMIEADSPGQVLGKSVYPLVKETHRQSFKEYLERVFQGISGVLEFEIVGLKGTRRWLESHAVPVRDGKGEITKILSVTRDISDRKRLEKQIFESIVKERRRLGQDLHDDIGQSLAGIALLTKGLEQRLSAKSLPEVAAAANITNLINQAIGQTRALVRGLLPVEAISHGLSSALEELASQTTAAFGISCKLQSPQPVEVRDNSVATHLFRIAQEAVTNAIKHGHAQQVLIELHQINGTTVLKVTDDGMGFGEVPQENNGMGLHIMKYRAEAIGGGLTIRRGESGGTVVSCSLENSEIQRGDQP